VKNTPSEKSGQNSPTQNIAEENLWTKSERIWIVYPGENKSAEQFNWGLRLCSYHTKNRHQSFFISGDTENRKWTYGGQEEGKS
jgi:hypothetical protein